MSEEILRDARRFAVEYYDQVPKPYPLKLHIDLVDKFSLQLAEQLGINPLTARLAAVLHDIGKVHGSKNHAIASAEIAKDFVNKTNLFSWQKDDVLTAIRSHSNRFSRDDDSQTVKIVQSADVLSRLFEPGFEDVDWSKVNKEYLASVVEKFDAKLTLSEAKELAKERLDVLRKHLD